MLKDDVLIGDLLVSIQGTLKDALNKINNSGRGICFLVDDNQKMLGLLTDGDIRRLFIDGHSTNFELKSLELNDFAFLKEGFSLIEAQEKLENFEVLPVLNESNIVSDFVSSDRLRKIPLINPNFEGKELEYLTDCINSGWISSIGGYVKKFENKFSKLVKTKHALCVSSGTTGLQVALKSLGIGDGDEVILPNLTFAATINSVLHVGAKPILVDINSETFCMEANDVEKLITKNTKCILLVHLYGNACELNKFYSLKEKYNLLLVEDCAEALGTKYFNNHVGRYSDASVYSFFGNKLITTGEGGMVCFNSKEIYELAKNLIAHGMSKKKKYWHDILGYNFRMTNIQAAIGLAQLEKINIFLDKKHFIGKEYSNLLKNEKRLNIQKIHSNVSSSYWLFVVVLNKEYIKIRDKIMDYLLKLGIETRPIFYPLNEMPPYKEFSQGAFTKSYLISYGGLCLPSNLEMTSADIEFVCINLSKAIDHFANK